MKSTHKVRAEGSFCRWLVAGESGRWCGVRWLARLVAMLGVFLLGVMTEGARGDVYRWDNGQLIEGTEGVVPQPWLDLSGWNTPDHHFEYGDFRVDVTGTSFAGSDLNHALFYAPGPLDPCITKVTEVDFSDASVTGAIFTGMVANGFTSAMLYSTSNYGKKDLTGMQLSSNNLSGWNFAGQNLTNVQFGKYWQFGYNYPGSNLTGADFTGAVIRGANFSSTSLSVSQLHSTASYQAGDLRGLTLHEMDMTGWNFDHLDLSGADFSSESFGLWKGAVLTGASFVGANLTSANFDGSKTANVKFTGANLTNAHLCCDLTGVDLTGAIIQGVNLSYRYGTLTHLTQAQFYSTASYASGDLRGVTLQYSTLRGWDFSGKNLAGADLLEDSFLFSNFAGADLSDTNLRFADLENVNLTGANLENSVLVCAHVQGTDFTGATIRGADLGCLTFPNWGFTKEQFYSTESYVSGDLRGVTFGGNSGGSDTDLSGWDFSGKNLSGTCFISVILRDANFTGAVVKGVNFEYTSYRGFTPAQLYSTKSYVTGNLSTIDLSHNDLTGWNFVGKNLTAAQFTETTLTNVSFKDADLRGASGWTPGTGTNVTNVIRPDGSIQGLHLSAGEVLIVQNYPMAITAKTTVALDTLSTLKFELDSNWGSQIRCATGVTPVLGGTLDLEVAPGVDPLILVGQTIPLFAWNGPLAVGNRFTTIVTDPLITVDVSNLYTTGTVTITGTTAVPEAGTVGVLVVGVVGLVGRRRRKK